MCNLEMCARCKGYFQCEPCVLIFKVLNHLAMWRERGTLTLLKQTERFDLGSFSSQKGRVHSPGYSVLAARGSLHAACLVSNILLCKQYSVTRPPSHQSI